MILYETANQGNILLYCLLFGILSGMFFDIGGLICFLCKNNKIVRFFCDLFSTILSFIVVFFICYKLNFGTFRLYIPLIFFAFVFLERITIGKLVAKGYEKCYNMFTKFSQRIVNLFNKNKNGTTKEKD